MALLSGKRAMMEQLLADGTRYIFGNPGTTEQAFMDMLQEYPALEFIMCLHEGVAVSMADAYARATRKPALVELHIAPGLGNGMGMLHNAAVGHSPVVVYVGQGDSRTMFQQPHLSGDLVGMARPLTKWAYEINHAVDLPQALRRAYKVANEPPQGPVVLSIPVDTLDQEAEVRIEPTQHTKWRVGADAAGIAEAAELLAGAKKPMLLVGDQVALSGAQELVGELAELVGAPIYQSYPTEVNVPTGHRLVSSSLPFIGSNAIREVVAQYDTLLAIGIPLFRVVFPEPGEYVPQSLKVIQIDLDSWELGKNLSNVLSIKADPRAALTALIQQLEGRRPAGAEDRANAIAADRETRAAAQREADRKGWDDVPIAVPRLMSELTGMLPEDVAVFDESVTSEPVLARYLKVKKDNYFRARSGGLGPGMPGAVGLKLARPNQPVVGVVADGSAMYSITALWTAAHHKVPVTWVICNNASYRILKLNLMEYLGPENDRLFMHTDIVDPAIRYDKLAESLGVRGWRVEKPEELRPAFEAALSLDAPALVDVSIQGRVR
ncbi:MAG TPA: thiamine pyrophosphate-binding protein [Chloroflexota bacterium]|nr:thiamine pyrophosphate-binding protein [Chloroflexota bacterium]